MVAALVAVVTFLLVQALSRSGEATDASRDDIAFFKAQRAEIARQRLAGTLSDTEAMAAEAESARRLLSVTRQNDAEKSGSVAVSTLWYGVVALMVPGLALMIYLTLGQPTVPDMPFADRKDMNPQVNELKRLVARLDAHLAESPNDVRGLELAYPMYLRFGRFDDAASALERLTKLKEPNADLFAVYAEALILAREGRVESEARVALDRALALNPKSARARYYAGLSADQQGKTEDALRIWESLRADLPEGAEKKAVLDQIARLSGAGKPSDTETAIRSMAPDERANAIRGMVDSLEARLKSDGGSLEQWARLIQSLSVLGEKSRAVVALEAAQKAFAGNDTALNALKKMATELSLETGTKP